MSMPVIHKKPGEKFPVGIKYRGADLLGGVTALSTVVTVAPVTTLVMGVSGVSADGTEAYCWFTVGTDLVDYTVRFTTTFSDGKILIDDYLIRVRN